MYELTYDIYLNEDRSSILQPLFNASVVTTRMDGYRETGAGNAGLSVDKQEWTTGTLCPGRPVDGSCRQQPLRKGKRWRNCVSTRPRTWETTVEKRQWASWPSRLHAASAWSESREDGVADRAGLSVPVGTQGDDLCERQRGHPRRSQLLNGSIGYRYDF